LYDHTSNILFEICITLAHEGVKVDKGQWGWPICASLIKFDHLRQALCARQSASGIIKDSEVGQHLQHLPARQSASGIMREAEVGQHLQHLPARQSASGIMREAEVGQHVHHWLGFVTSEKGCIPSNQHLALWRNVIIIIHPFWCSKFSCSDV
jgi:hypothetical protein